MDMSARLETYILKLLPDSRIHLSLLEVRRVLNSPGPGAEVKATDVREPQELWGAKNMVHGFTQGK